MCVGLKDMSEKADDSVRNASASEFLCRTKEIRSKLQGMPARDVSEVGQRSERLNIVSCSINVELLAGRPRHLMVSQNVLMTLNFLFHGANLGFRVDGFTLCEI